MGWMVLSFGGEQEGAWCKALPGETCVYDVSLDDNSESLDSHTVLRSWALGFRLAVLPV